MGERAMIDSATDRHHRTDSVSIVKTESLSTVDVTKRR